MTRSDYTERRDGAKRGLSEVCPECGGCIRSTSGETVCDGCGLVLEETGIDTAPEWRGFDPDDDRERTGAPATPTRHDRGISTEIGRAKDAKGTHFRAGSGGSSGGSDASSPGVGGAR